MVAFAVQQLQADVYAVIFRNLLYAIEPDDGILRALFVGHAGAVSRERNDVRNARFGGKRNVFSKSLFDGGVILDSIEGLGNVPATGVSHRADEAVALGNLVLIRFEEINAFQSNLCGIF